MILYSTQTTEDPYARNTVRQRMTPVTQVKVILFRPIDPIIQSDVRCSKKKSDNKQKSIVKTDFLLSWKIQTNSKTRYVSLLNSRFTDKIYNEPYIVYFPSDNGSQWTSYPVKFAFCRKSFWNGSANKTNGNNYAPSCTVTRISGRYGHCRSHCHYRINAGITFYSLLPSIKRKIKKNHRTVWAHGSVYFK